MKKVACDQMLGSLAKWLRLLGIDTYFAKGTISDDDLLSQAIKEKRLLITRDKGLITRAHKQKIPVIHITSIKLEQQLTQVISVIPISTNAFFSRCILCNTPVQKVAKNTAVDHIPPKVFEAKNDFWFCPTCNKYYWQGSHYEKINQAISNLLNNKIK
jgi:uncharacterized protein with PIN domain